VVVVIVAKVAVQVEAGRPALAVIGLATTTEVGDKLVVD